MACENCRLDAACEMLQRPEPAGMQETMRVLGALTARDSQRLDRAVEAAGEDGSVTVDGQDCLEPKSGFMGFGRTACQGRLVIEKVQAVEAK